MNSVELSDRLRNLYRDSSKHSMYQNIPDFVQDKLGYSESINEEWRGDTARYQYISEYIFRKNFKKILDIGANTGFFTHSLAYNFPEISFTAIEPNKNHSEFIKEINEIFKLENIDVANCSLGLEDLKEWNNKADCALLLNILHHAGGDFDQHLLNSPEGFWDYFRNYMNDFHNVSGSLILQVGYNWWGDKSKPIIKPEHLSEMFESLVKNISSTGWEIQDIAYYLKSMKQYKEVPRHIFGQSNKMQMEEEISQWMYTNDINNNSEFYKRPIVILTGNLL